MVDDGQWWYLLLFIIIQLIVVEVQSSDFIVGHQSEISMFDLKKQLFY